MAINIKTNTYSVVRNTSPGRVKPKYIVMHYTAADNATAHNNVLYFATNPTATNASADFFVDDNEIWQYNNVIDGRYTWAVGDGAGGTYGGKCNNTNQISVEMCCWYDRFNTGKWYINDKTFNNAVALVRELMKKYSIPAENVIRHYDVSGKHCPGAVGWGKYTGSDDTWIKFKKAISNTTTKTVNTATKSTIYRLRKSVNDAKSQIGAYSVLENAKKHADKSGYNVYDETGKLVYSPKTAKKSNSEIAKEVIAGKWGNGNDRKNRLTVAGYDYAAVQAEVNKLMR